MDSFVWPLIANIKMKFFRVSIERKIFSSGVEKMISKVGRIVKIKKFFGKIVILFFPFF